MMMLTKRFGSRTSLGLENYLTKGSRARANRSGSFQSKHQNVACRASIHPASHEDRTNRMAIWNRVSIALSFVCFLCLGGTNNAFTCFPAATTTRSQPIPHYLPYDISTHPPCTILPAKKDKNEREKVKQEWDVSLLLQFMTPWKNPNSIFVYLFLILYILGTISEARN